MWPSMDPQAGREMNDLSSLLLGLHSPISLLSYHLLLRPLSSFLALSLPPNPSLPLKLHIRL